MSLERLKIRRAIVEILKGKTACKDRVFPSRVRPIWEAEELPLILVYTDSETIEIYAQPKLYKRTLLAHIEVICRNNDTVQDEIDLICAEIEYALAQDFKLGLGDLVQESALTNITMVFDAAGNKEIGAAVLSFSVEYYSRAVTDPIELVQFQIMDTKYPFVGTTEESPIAEDITAVTGD